MVGLPRLTELFVMKNKHALVVKLDVEMWLHERFRHLVQVLSSCCTPQKAHVNLTPLPGTVNKFDSMVQ